jgi:hypothetical protein
MEKSPDLNQLTADQLRTMVAQLSTQVRERDEQITRQARLIADRDTVQTV